jgi:hypothetical protein
MKKIEAHVDKSDTMRYHIIYEHIYNAFKIGCSNERQAASTIRVCCGVCHGKARGGLGLSPPPPPVKKVFSGTRRNSVLFRRGYGLSARISVSFAIADNIFAHNKSYKEGLYE